MKTNMCDACESEGLPYEPGGFKEEYILKLKHFCIAWNSLWTPLAWGLTVEAFLFLQIWTFRFKIFYIFVLLKILWENLSD